MVPSISSFTSLSHANSPQHQTTSFSPPPNVSSNPRALSLPSLPPLPKPPRVKALGNTLLHGYKTEAAPRATLAIFAAPWEYYRIQSQQYGKLPSSRDSWSRWTKRGFGMVGGLNLRVNPDCLSGQGRSFHTGPVIASSHSSTTNNAAKLKRQHCSFTHASFTASEQRRDVFCFCPVFFDRYLQGATWCSAERHNGHTGNVCGCQPTLPLFPRLRHAS